MIRSVGRRGVQPGFFSLSLSRDRVYTLEYSTEVLKFSMGMHNTLASTTYESYMIHHE